MTHSRLPDFRRLVSGGAEEAGMKGWRGRAADIGTRGRTFQWLRHSTVVIKLDHVSF